MTHSTARHATAAPNIPLTIPDPAPTGITANPAAVRVIRLWADDLRRGDVRAAARWFALPSLMINGGAGDVSVSRIRTVRQAQAANEMLPCGAKFLSADMRGRYVNALFELTGRSGPGGTNCGGGAGGTARTNFVIAERPDRRVDSRPGRSGREQLRSDCLTARTRQPEMRRLVAGLAARADLELAEDRRHVVVDRLFG